MVDIRSDCGRIGHFWWINSDLTPQFKTVPLTIGIVDFQMMYAAWVVRWGSCGFGIKHQAVTWEEVE